MSDEESLNLDYLEVAPTTSDVVQQTSSRMSGTRQVDTTVRTASLITPTARTTTILTAAPTFQTPTIAVTSTTSTTSAIATKPSKRSTKIDFVRFDSVETIFKQTDHDEIIQRAKIKDEIKR